MAVTMAALVVGVLPIFSESTSSPFQIIQQETAYHGKYANLTVVYFTGQSGKVGVWEVMNTATPKDPDQTNGVYVIARLRIDGESYFVFNKQYRIPTGSWTLEFPGGVQEKDESPISAGLRELREETGYVASVLFSSSGKQPSMPSRLNDTTRHVVADVDDSADVNVHPNQQLDDEEVSNVLLIKASELLPTIRSLERELDIASNVYTFAIGYAMQSL